MRRHHEHLEQDSDVSTGNGHGSDRLEVAGTVDTVNDRSVKVIVGRAPLGRRQAAVVVIIIGVGGSSGGCGRSRRLSTVEELCLYRGCHVRQGDASKGQD